MGGGINLKDMKMSAFKVRFLKIIVILNDNSGMLVLLYVNSPVYTSVLPAF